MTAAIGLAGRYDPDAELRRALEVFDDFAPFPSARRGAARLIEQSRAPTLILAGDHDMVRMEHVVEIFNRLQNSQLGILPNSTHMAPYDNPELFNGAVERFLATPFTRRDRIADFVTSYEKLLANLPR